jgi:hypothetical protein
VFPHVKLKMNEDIHCAIGNHLRYYQTQSRR